MGQRSNYATKKDAQNELNKVECVKRMGLRPNDATLNDAQIMVNKVECV